MKPCEDCGGTGYGSCINCGDGWSECACEDPEEVECTACEGVGEVMEEKETDDGTEEE